MSFHFVENEISKLVDDFSSDGVMFALFNNDQVDDIQSVLLNIYRTSIASNKAINIVIVCGFRCTRDIIKAVCKFIQTML
jgi:hypothetical protein